ncbi:hypothetical protein [Thermomonospora umbrina]|uniref:Magnesium transporter NIPA n=1 Tax=Thermomonospora umbrina TaxID=111806 RepID=A0A3D9T0E6_9ACTN|nr:hypothetical protein [Thermomonospora umbrina]REE98274.1 hypothetical protein DFJ69_3758 [Thermomonospora umbrina]
MGAVVLASAAPVAYVTAFAIFKTTASRMPTLSGSRPIHTTRHLALNPIWMFGLFTMVTGLITQSVVMTTLPVSAVVPMYGPVMLVLLLIAIANFGERVQAGEIKALSVLVLALLFLAAAGDLLSGDDPPSSSGPWDASVALWKLGLVVVPSVVIPMWLFTVRDRPVAGRHAKRITGVSFGIGAGILVGCAESSGASMAHLVKNNPDDYVNALLASPHPYVVVVTGLLGLGLAQIGLQRCRLSVVIVVLAVSSKASMWLTGILVYGQPWPQTSGKFFLTGMGLVLCCASVMLLPRHEPEEDEYYESEAAEDASPREVTGHVSTI